ncbi:AAA family ATPase [Nocardia sp. NPDC052566]|uniref:AAA family ATPase n=1 Tax=Nocardia sp. NPDC052566 TaxID=3364330 RepID=UPI0037C8E463
MSTVVVIRGNSASGKSTVAAAVQRRFRRGRCVVIPQDVVRRQMMRESDTPGGFTVELIEHIAALCLSRGLVVIVEGILDADRYGAMLERVAAAARTALFYSFDLTFEETLRRHAGRPQAATIPESQMALWFHGWQPLSFAAETRIDESWGADEIVERIHRDITAAR